MPRAVLAVSRTTDFARALVICCAVFAVAACGARPGVREVRAPTGVLLIVCDVADAEVFVGDRPAGRVASVRGGIRLQAGNHRVEVRHESHHTRYLDVALAAGARQTVTVTMVEALD